MDFWASLEHKIFYKYNKAVPEKITRELKEAAESANELDRKMETLHKEILELKQLDEEDTVISLDELNKVNIPVKFLEMMNENNGRSTSE